MKVSLNWLRELLPLDQSIEEISDLLTFAGVEVEGIETRGADFPNVIVGQILSSEQHPNADRLSVCKVNDGTEHARQIVCGAKNYVVGDKVPVALPGAVLPGDFKIKVGKLRGVNSEGMMCSAKELNLSEESAGLLILPPETIIGTPIGQVFPADTIFDLEITPNRPDLLSHTGIARELGAITGERLVTSDEEQLVTNQFYNYDNPNDSYGKRRFTNPQTALENLQRSALDDARGSCGADAAERLRSESESLLGWAKANGYLVEAESFRSAVADFQEFEGGAEHLVWRDQENGRVIKATKPPNFGVGGKLSRYIANVILSNNLFGDDIRIEAIVADVNGAVLVISQPFIRGNSPTEEEICAWMKERGFESLGSDIFQNEAGVKVADVRPANIIKSGGDLYPIDVHVFEPPQVSDEVQAPDVSNSVTTLFPVRLESDACPFYSARVIRKVKVGPSPEWLVSKLQSVGLRPINNVVDITNFVMLEMGQPLHAFDLAKVDREIVVRNALSDEKFLALDGRTYSLKPEDIVIADGSRALAIAGVMGGEESGVTVQTTDILLESAFFLPANIRRTSRTLGLSSDSSYRFERGVDPGKVLAASERACQLLGEIAGGEAGSGPSLAGHLPPLEWSVSLRNERCRKVLGADIPDSRISEILTGLGLAKSDSENNWLIPSFRADLTREIDLIEEVARVHGIQNIPSSAGGFAVPISAVDRLYDFQIALKRILAARGFSETRTLSLRPAAETALRTESAISVRNPLTEDQTAFRESLIAGLLTVAEFNQRMGATSIRLMETGRIFAAGPVEEKTALALLVTGQTGSSDWRNQSADFDFFGLKAEITGLVNAPLSFKKSTHPAVVLAAEISLGGKKIGWIGQLSPALVRDAGIKTPVFCAELELGLTFTALPANRSFSPLPKYPAITRDIALLAPQTLSHSELETTLLAAKEPLLVSVSLFDLFTDPSGEKIPADKKSLAYSLTYRAEDRTLTQDEVNTAHAALKVRLVEKCGITLRE